jgi:carbon monoxide dehydrogenase subunit G
VQLEHTFTIPVDIEQAWAVLLDIERIAPCMPGAALDSVDGDNFTGSVKVRLGPIGLTYKGKASFLEKDATAHRVVIDAQGKDARGNGTAAAKVTATLNPDGAGTQVKVTTDLNVTGKPAQFGRGVMVEVGNKLIGQFADCLAGKLTAGDVTQTAASKPPAADQATPAGQAAPSPSAAPSAAPAREPAKPRVVAQREEQVEPIDLLGSAGPAIAKRLLPVAAAVVLILLAMLRRRHRR